MKQVACDVCEWVGTPDELEMFLRGEPQCPRCGSDELNFAGEDEEATQ